MTTERISLVATGRGRRVTVEEIKTGAIYYLEHKSGRFTLNGVVCQGFDTKVGSIDFAVILSHYHVPYDRGSIGIFMDEIDSEWFVYQDQSANNSS